MNGKRFLDETIDQLHYQKSLADGALRQVSEEQFFAAPDGHSTSLAIVVKHVGGNLRSRWTDFLTTDGDKPDRNRDGEFVVTERDTRAKLEEIWEEGWRRTFDSLAALDAAVTDATVTIRGQPHTVSKAIQRSLAHTAYHVGQIVWLARHLIGPNWQTLSIAPGRSSELDASMRARWSKSGASAERRS